MAPAPEGNNDSDDASNDTFGKFIVFHQKVDFVNIIFIFFPEEK